MRNIPRRKRLETTITLSIVFSLISGFKYYKTQELEFLFIVFNVGFVLAIFIKPFGEILTFIWSEIGKVLGFVNSRIILTVLFFLVLTPLAFFYRIFGSKQKTGFIERNYSFKKSDLSKTW